MDSRVAPRESDDLFHEALGRRLARNATAFYSGLLVLDESGRLVLTDLDALRDLAEGEAQ